MTQRFWIVKSKRPNSKNKIEKVSVHTWELGKELSAPIWQSRKIQFSRGNNVLLPEYPSCIEPIWIGGAGGDCYLGLNNGGVHAVLCADSPEHRQIETLPSRFPDYNSLRGEARMNEEHLIISGVRKILSLVNFRGKFYDASFSGLFETGNGKQIDPRRIKYAGVYNGRLCIVPTYPEKKDLENGKENKDYHVGSLVDALTKEVIIEKLTPFDGSGCKQADYLIHEDRAFVHHGDWPDEKITIRGFPSGEVITSIQIPTSEGFILHQGQVYDFRDLRQIGEDGVGLMKSDVKGRQEPLFRIPQSYTSAVSAGDKGIFLALYDSKVDRSRLISHLYPDKPFLESAGRLAFFSHRDS